MCNYTGFFFLLKKKKKQNIQKKKKKQQQQNTTIPLLKAPKLPFAWFQQIILR